MKRFFSVLLCIVMCFTFSITAFAGGPRAEEDMLAVQNMDDSIETLLLPDGLCVGSVYKLRSMASLDSNPFVLNVPDGNDTKKLDMWTLDTNGKPDQKFRLVPSNSYYKLIAECSASGKVMDAYRINGNIINGCSADLWSESDNPAQQLVITSESSGGYSVRLASNTSLALTAVSLTNGGTVQFQTYIGSSTQRWDFIIQNDAISLSRAPNSDAQNKTKWCWAAAAKMVGIHNGGLNSEISTDAQPLKNTANIKNPFYGYGNVNGTTKYFADGVQYAILRYIKDTDGNESGSDTDSVNALQYVSKNTMKVGHHGIFTEALPQSEIDKINKDLRDKKYVIGSMTSRESAAEGNADTAYGHSVVIQQYEPGANGQEGRYYVFDPLTGKTDWYYQSELFGDDFGYKSEGHDCRISWHKWCR